jgi:hypothetical protein
MFESDLFTREDRGNTFPRNVGDHVIPEGLFEKECCGVYWNILRRSERNWRNIRNEELHGLFSTPDVQTTH